jgi:hypothetical protein
MQAEPKTKTQAQAEAVSGKRRKAVVVGAGPVGSLMARGGWSVAVCDAR